MRKMNKQRFFAPFVGDKYQEGINGKKILVVGASFYCNRTQCKFFLQCTNTENKDSSPFDVKCPEYAKAQKQLHNEPAYCIGDAPRTYKTFASYISKLIGDDSYEHAWSYLAFTNYVQFFLPSKGESFRETRMTDLSERDFHAFNETLVELQPDIVIIWGCVINTRLREQNEYLVDKEELERTEWYVCHIKVPGVNHEIALINPYHPSSNAWYSNIGIFDKYLSKELV
ncbi:hypothetical protein [Bacteroides fluxus]|uniref:hypothetical protein n=1 Tax=Bacteroides fluxus TaxID=626930 RepID=UPI002354924B|nr:hypothetical protein [Bacteroides fluxus]